MGSQQHKEGRTLFSILSGVSTGITSLAAGASLGTAALITSAVSLPKYVYDRFFQKNSSSSISPEELLERYLRDGQSYLEARYLSQRDITAQTIAQLKSKSLENVCTTLDAMRISTQPKDGFPQSAQQMLEQAYNYDINILTDMNAYLSEDKNSLFDTLYTSLPYGNATTWVLLYDSPLPELAIRMGVVATVIFTLVSLKDEKPTTLSKKRGKEGYARFLQLFSNSFPKP